MNREQIEKVFDSFKGLQVLVIGDVMVDAYLWGNVNRISPEAPVPIVSVEKKEARLGGAANVALNIQSLGANPILCTLIGDDDDGEVFLELLDKMEQSAAGILKSKEATTTKKTRIIGNNHQMLRIDAEDTQPLSSENEFNLINKIKELLQENPIDVVIFEDYDKGVITENLIKETVSICKERGIPTTVDPKKRNFGSYQEVTLFKPNLKELVEGLKVDIETSDLNEIDEALDKLINRLNCEMTLLTLSEQGVMIKSSSEQHHIHAHRRDITDVSGAGDTVISVASLCLALKLNPKEIAELANLAGGLVCENVGVVPIEIDRLKEEAIKVFSTS